MTSRTFSREIAAPVEVVFDLCRSIDFHIEAGRTINARADAGQTEGLAEEGSMTVYSAAYFGLRFRLAMTVSDMHPPYRFKDQMTRGLFRHFSHHYRLTERNEGCLLEDTFSLAFPLGQLGHWLGMRFISPALYRAQDARLNAIQRKAEEENI